MVEEERAKATKATAAAALTVLLPLDTALPQLHLDTALPQLRLDTEPLQHRQDTVLPPRPPLLRPVTTLPHLHHRVIMPPFQHHPVTMHQLLQAPITMHLQPASAFRSPHLGSPQAVDLLRSYRRLPALHSLEAPVSPLRPALVIPLAPFPPALSRPRPLRVTPTLPLLAP